MNSNARNLGGICRDSISFSCDAVAMDHRMNQSNSTAKSFVGKVLRLIKHTFYVVFWCGALHFFFIYQRRSEVPGCIVSYLLIVNLKQSEVHTSITVSYMWTVFHHVVSQD